jgi:hypothetical protein
MAIEGFVQYYVNHLKEDVKQVLFQITPTDTPFYNMTGDGKALSPKHEWLLRSLTTRSHNAHQEGASFVNQVGHVTTREVNYTQIFRKTPSVTRTAQETAFHAIEDPFLDEMETAMMEMKTDMDLSFVKGSMQTLGTSITRQMDGLIYILSRSGLWSRSTDVTLTESLLNDIAQTVWQQGVKSSDILCGDVFKRRIGGFSGWQDTGFGQVVQRELGGEDYSLTARVDVYSTDFVDARVHIDRNLAADSGNSNQKYLVLFDRRDFKKAWISPPFTARRPYNADSEDGVILAEGTLSGGHTKSGGWFCGQ